MEKYLDLILLVLITITTCTVVLIETWKHGEAPIWFINNIVPILVTTIVTIRMAMSKKQTDENDNPKK